MRTHHVRVRPSADAPPREEELAWRIAEVAADPVPLDDAVAETVIDRIIDNAAVSVASLRRAPVANARRQAMAHPAAPGATVLGLDPERRSSPEWAAWANGVAVRELDFHDTFLAADYSHPGDNIPPILAVAQHCGLSGADLARGIATGYEIQVDLVRGICLHEHRIDHIAHLGPVGRRRASAPRWACRRRSIYQAVGQALHVTTTTRQSRKGEISSWKAYAPAFAGKMAVEAVDRAMRGEGAPAPDLRGRGRRHRVAARRPGGRVRGAAARARRGQARDPRHLHQGALGRVPGAGADRPGPAPVAAGSATWRGCARS